MQGFLCVCLYSRKLSILVVVGCDSSCEMQKRKSHIMGCTLSVIGTFVLVFTYSLVKWYIVLYFAKEKLRTGPLSTVYIA